MTAKEYQFVEARTVVYMPVFYPRLYTTEIGFPWTFMESIYCPASSPQTVTIEYLLPVVALHFHVDPRNVVPIEQLSPL